MKRETGTRAVCMLCGLLLIAASCAAAAAVTHGDLMLSGGTPFTPYQIQFHGPRGKLKATVQVKGCKIVWGRSVSQDGRYAVVGCSFQRPGTKAIPGPHSFFDYRNDPIKVVLLQLTGRSPKVLGARVLPGYNNGTTTGCFYADADRTPYVSSPLALRSSVLPGGAGAVLEVFLSIRCLPVTPACANEVWAFGASAVQLWTVTHKQFKTIGPLVPGERAAFRDKVKCGAEGLSVAVTANGKVYAAFGFNVAEPSFFDTIGLYEVRRNPKHGMQLIPTWKVKIGFLSVLKFLPTGPLTGCGIVEEPAPISEGNKVYSFAKGRAPYTGGISTAAIDRSYWDISCRGDVVYANVLVSNTYRVLKVSTGLLKKGATGNVVFNAANALECIAIIP